MTLFVLSYLAGALTILAPCILPVIPFLFARADYRFARGGLPLLTGMAVSFAVVATLATFGAAWAAEANEIGRGAAMVVLSAVGLSLLVPSLAQNWLRPLVTLGSNLDEAVRRRAAPGHPVAASFVLGVATGLLWAPCAGPVLALVLTTAAIEGPSVRTSLLLLAYATGAATSLGLALWLGGRVLNEMKRFLGVANGLRRGIGALVLAGVAMVAMGLDTGLLARLTPQGDDALEQFLMERWRPETPAPVDPAPRPRVAAEPKLVTVRAQSSQPTELPVEGELTDLSGATAWLNSSPLTAQQLRGKVVLIDFWTFACINCQRALPYVRAWSEKYKDQGLVVIGVHSPEFAFERKLDNVKRAVAELDLRFPIAIDNDFAIWRAFSNRYWPANYFIDAQGHVRFHHFGEGEYARSEEVIRQLLDEANGAAVQRSGTSNQYTLQRLPLTTAQR